jgi:capsular exopolysaccharide synthesis family protein
MSRVFEALTKAGEEKLGQTQRPLEQIEGLLLSIPEEAKKFEPGPQFGLKDTSIRRTNGKINEINESYLQITNGNKPWLERIEGWLIGWGLGSYDSYPIVAMEKESPGSEQYKMLREQLKRLRVESGIRSFTITSPVKRDGKTTVAVNLAAALSLDYEESVLLIDGDLRAPNLHRYFNASQSPGLTDYLDSDLQMNLKGLVQDTFLPGLRILPSGKPSHLASELLAKERMKKVIEEAHAQFPGHQIIIDSPPVLSTPDPLVIARHVDGVLVVIRAGKTPRDYLTKALQLLNSSRVLGVVLNGAELGIASKYYYYSTNGA